MKFLIALFSFLAISNAQVILNGTCGQVDLVKNFSVPSYSGLWYEIYRYKNEFQPNGNCVTAQYTQNSQGVDVFNTMVVSNFKISINGTAKLTDDANGQGKLIVNFPSADNIYSDYWVLNTDYKNFSLVYACTNLANNQKRVSSWILSREKFLSPQSLLAIQPNIDSAKLDWNTYSETLHDDKTCRILN